MMTPIERAIKIRALLNDIIIQMNDEEAIEKDVLFPKWNSNNLTYLVGDRVLYNDKLYKVLQNHVSQENWNPKDAVSLFAEILIPNEDIIVDWVQPDSINPYMLGDKVKYNNLIWESTIDNNVWAPGVYGWIQVEN